MTFDTLHSLVYEHHLLQYLSGVLYAAFAVGLLSLGLRQYDALSRGDTSVGQFPTGYFATLVAQLLPMTLTGIVIADGFIITTRAVTLMVVLTVFALATSPSGLNTPRNQRWALVWLGSAMLVPILWVESPLMRHFVTNFESVLSWGVIGLMFLFIWKGQRAVARELYQHFMDGNYTVKRLRLQLIRLGAFATQAVHYWLMPSSAAPFFGIDPVFLQGAMGAGGVVYVLGSASIGWLLGRQSRQAKLRLA